MAKTAKPHKQKECTVSDLDMSVGAYSRNSKPEAKSSGVKTRGNGAAKRGVTARGPMA